MIASNLMGIKLSGSLFNYLQIVGFAVGGKSVGLALTNLYNGNGIGRLIDVVLFNARVDKLFRLL